MSNRVNVDQFLIEVSRAGISAGFTVEPFGSINERPLLGLTRPAKAHAPTTGESKGALYISAGIHGDEPAAPMALLELLQDNSLPTDRQIYLCPMLNPSGFLAVTRESAQGIDLNRDYTDFISAEIAAHKKWIEQKVASVQLVIHLHEDWEATGFYMYELNFGSFKSRADEILAAVCPHVPIDPAEEIDGRSASDGIIRPDTLPEIEEGLPEAIYFQQRYHCLNYTLETPSGLDLSKRIAALKAAVLASYSDDQ